MLFNWTNQDKMCEFSRKSSVSKLFNTPPPSSIHSQERLLPLFHRFICSFIYLISVCADGGRGGEGCFVLDKHIVICSVYLSSLHPSNISLKRQQTNNNNNNKNLNKFDCRYSEEKRKKKTLPFFKSLFQSDSTIVNVLLSD